MFVLLRLIGSLVLIAPLLVLGGQRLLPEPGERIVLFWVGQLQVSRFMICSVIGLSILPASRAIVLGFTMPLWAIPIGHFLWPEPISRGQLVGAVIGFVGLVLFMNPGLVDWSNRRILAGNAMLLLAAILWALGSRLYRQRISTISSLSFLPRAGGKNRRGARRVLVEGAWSYRFPARVSQILQARLEGLPKPVREIAWKAQIRLYARYRRLSAASKKRPVVIAAIAREMAAFLWAIAQHVASTA